MMYQLLDGTSLGHTVDLFQSCPEKIISYMGGTPKVRGEPSDHTCWRPSDTYSI